MYTLITGGNRGLGLDVARKLVNSGSRVILTSRNTAAGQAARQSILDASQVPADHCVALQLDVSSEESIQQLADVIGKEFHGQVGTVVNNAGYALQKAMLNRASQLYARDPRLTGRGITCCAADPGWCRTDMGGGGAPRRAGQGGDSILHCIHNREGCNGGVWLDGRRTL
eukprot:jgi/Astpho2/1170/Aster-x0986